MLQGRQGNSMPRIRKEEVFEALPEVADLDRLQAQIEQWGTTTHLSKVCRMVKSNVIANLVRLQREGRAHVHAWESSGPAPIWVRGAGESAPRPHVTEESRLRLRREHDRRYQERKKAGKVPDQQPGRAILRTIATIERAREAPKSWFSALEDAAGEQA